MVSLSYICGHARLVVVLMMMFTNLHALLRERKWQKQESLTTTLVGAATTFANDISPKSTLLLFQLQQHLNEALPCHLVEQRMFA